MSKELTASVGGSERTVTTAGASGVAGGLNISALIDSFLGAQDVREISKTLYRKGLERFLGWLSFNQIERPDRNDVLRFRDSLTSAGLAANSVNAYLSGVRKFFAWLESMRKYPNIARDVKGAKQSRAYLRQALTLAQVKSTLSQLDTLTIQGKRDFAIINLMTRTGLRTIEVVRANIEDLKQESGESLLYIQGKGRDSKDEFVLLTPGALNPLMEYLKTRGRANPQDPLFVSLSDRNSGQRLSTKTLRQIVKANFRKINLDSRKLSAHSLRHTFATQALRSGAPLIQVQSALRHKSIETTQLYCHNIDRIDRAAERYIDF